ncbi:hypothetical protein VTP01DRAFT_2846 [Rhizomucor pusillus]|uniref:uncharacterized protein n=1 Tax=Rhizomucor pusillus TaxID=4840 RepID=UPI003744A422
MQSGGPHVFSRHHDVLVALLVFFGDPELWAFLRTKRLIDLAPQIGFLLVPGCINLNFTSGAPCQYSTLQKIKKASQLNPK